MPDRPAGSWHRAGVAGSVTAGTTLRGLAREVSLAAKESLQPARRLTPVWLIVIVLLMLAFAMFGDRGVLRTIQSNRHRVELEKELQVLQEERQRLRDEIGRLRKDKDYWEQLARKKLGMVREGELIYQFNGDTKAAE